MVPLRDVQELKQDKMRNTKALFGIKYLKTQEWKETQKYEEHVGKTKDGKNT